MQQKTVDPREVDKFERLEGQEMLELMVPIKMQYIVRQVPRIVMRAERLKVLDVGCNVGLLCEALSRAGCGMVSGIDASGAAVGEARDRASSEGLDIRYFKSSVEDLGGLERYDVITAMDILEHVLNPDLFISSCLNRLSAGGVLLLCTINNTLWSKIFVKFAAEYVLGMLPRGTHDCEKFVSPEWVVRELDRLGEFEALRRFGVIDITGLRFNLMQKSFSFSKRYDGNYFMTISGV